MVYSNVKQKNLSAYHHNAEQFAKRFDGYGPYQKKVLSFQQKYLSKGNQILDLGCGPGLTARQLLDLDSSYQIVGIDLAPRMIELAQQRVPEGDFRVGEIIGLSLTQCFDAVIASFCIVHLTDEETEALIRSLPTLLNPGGSLYLSFMTGKPPGLENTSFSAEPIFFNYFEPAQIQQSLVQAGFIIKKCVLEDYPEMDGQMTTDVFLSAQLS